MKFRFKRLFCQLNSFTSRCVGFAVSSRGGLGYASCKGEPHDRPLGRTNACARADPSLRRGGHRGPAFFRRGVLRHGLVAALLSLQLGAGVGRQPDCARRREAAGDDAPTSSAAPTRFAWRGHRPRAATGRPRSTAIAGATGRRAGPGRRSTSGRGAMPRLPRATCRSWRWSTRCKRIGRTIPQHRVPLSQFTGDIPAKQWVRIAIPLTQFQATSIDGFDPSRVSALVLSQGAAVDGKAHELILDDLRIQPTPVRPPCRPRRLDLTATGYERHVLLQWRPVADPDVAQYVVSRSLNGGPWKPVGGAARRGHPLRRLDRRSPCARRLPQSLRAPRRWPSPRHRTRPPPRPTR